MAEKLLIDAHYIGETRIAIVDGNGVLLNFEAEYSKKRPIKGNIYLAKIERIESSIQSAFINYGEDKHGFLPLSEIHHDFFDKGALEIDVDSHDVNEQESQAEQSQQQVEKVQSVADAPEKEGQSQNLPVPLQVQKKKKIYKIQDVVSNNQIVLVQAEKEIRGNKCASFTTFLSLPGRYCVLVPNAVNGKIGAISKKIEQAEKDRLKKIISEIDMPDGIGCIIRTAGQNRTKQEIKRDFEYLLRLWEEIQAKVAESTFGLVYEEGNIIKRTIRDLYKRNTEKIVVQGIEAYKEARTFMKLFTPSHVKKIKLYNDDQVPIFHKYNVEEKIARILDSTVKLASGGTIVINQTEALTAIDVNSGKMRKERDISDTAFKTNMEAAVEIARQIQLRDISGIIVVDFIDMVDKTSAGKVEKKFKDSIKTDYSSIQIGKISNFGLLEISRQRLRSSLTDSNFVQCKHCHGSGKVLAKETVALCIIRKIEAFLISERVKTIVVEVSDGVDSFILNFKRKLIVNLEDAFDVMIEIRQGVALGALDCRIIVGEYLPIEGKASVEDEQTEENGNETQKHEQKNHGAHVAEKNIGTKSHDMTAKDSSEPNAIPLIQTNVKAAGDSDEENNPLVKKKRRRKKPKKKTEEESMQNPSGEILEENAALPFSQKSQKKATQEESCLNEEPTNGERANSGNNHFQKSYEKLSSAEDAIDPGKKHLAGEAHAELANKNWLQKIFH